MYQNKAYPQEKGLAQGVLTPPVETPAEEWLRVVGQQQAVAPAKKTPFFSISRPFSKPRVKKADFIDFFTQLATLLDSQMPFIQALWLLAEQAPKAALKDVISRLGKDVSSGAPFSMALAKYPKLLSSHYCQVIKVSEKSGELPRGLRLVAGYMDKEASLTGHVTRVLSYPAFLAVMAVVVIIIIASVTVPSLSKLFNSLGVNLPLVTKMLVAFANFITGYGIYVALLIGAIVVVWTLIKNKPGVKRLLDKLVLKMPIIGNIVIMRNICRFCRSSAMLIEAGLTLPQALNAIIGTFDSDIMKNALRDIRQEIIKGKGLSQPMEKAGFFPRLLIDVVAIGERTGTLQNSFSTMADYYEKRLDMRVTRLLGMIEPASIILVGLIISFIGVAIIMPLYSIYQNMS